MTNKVVTNKDRLYAYVRGWKDGAASLSMRKEFCEHDSGDMCAEYINGYDAGRAKLREVVKAVQYRLGVKLSILRTMTGEGGK